MPRGVHKNPMLGWNPPAELSAWAREEAGRRSVALSTILTEALSEYRAKHQGAPVTPPRARKVREDAAARTALRDGDWGPLAGELDAALEACPHPKARINKGLCGACGTNVGTTKGGA